MADYDLSKPAPDRSHKRAAGTGTGSLGFILAGCVIVLVVLYAIFGGAGVPVSQDGEGGSQAAIPDSTAPAPGQ